VAQVVAADGSVTRRAYQDWRELVLDAEGHQTEYEKDGLGRLIAVREYYGTYGQPTWNPGESLAETRYWYDAAGNLIAVRDALGNATRMQYDPLGRKVAMDDPSMGHWEYRYDTAGNLVKQRDARGQAICFYYDALNRPIGKTYHANVVNLDGLICPGGPYTVSYDYDRGPNGIGQRTGMTDTTGVTAWQYDARGRVLTETRTLSNIGTFVTGWGYDAAGRAVRQVYPDGEIVTTTYSLRGLPTAVGGQSAYLTDATYNALGQPLQQTWGNNRATTYAYHPQNVRLTQLTVGGNLLDLRYGYDRVGNITAITDTVNSNQVQTFGYDARDRLVWARTNGVGNGQYNEAYGYDRMGNIITRTVGGAPQSYTYGCPPPSIASTLPPTLTHRVYFPLVMKGYGPESPPMAACVAPFAVVSTTAGFRAVYDPNGNMTLRVEVSGTQRITYTQEFNVENRLTAVTNTVTGQVTRFVYDGDGNRILRVDGSGTTVTIGDYYEKQGAAVTKYYYAGGQRIAVRVNGTLYFLHGDHLGSATVATDGSGNRVGELRYTPYGVTRYEWGSTPTNRRYTGQPWEGVGLYDYGARMYSPSLGRFVSADAVIPNPGNPQDLNRYAYARNSPLVYADPDGHFPWLVIPALVIVAVVCTRSTVDPVLVREANYIESLQVTASTDVDSLVEMFRTDQLRGSTAQERLATILDHTRLFPGLYTAGGFGETGLNVDFQDGYLYEQYWGGETRQVGHFLTAAAFGYRASQYSDPWEFLTRFAVGHEIVGDQGAPLSWTRQFLAATPEARNLFRQAIEADAAGRHELRDEYLRQILALNSAPLEVRRGNSLEDLRLTVRGWRFGQMVAMGQFASLEEAAQWLNDNLR
jgi:RHS repeat-associated protein